MAKKKEKKTKIYDKSPSEWVSKASEFYRKAKESRSSLEWKWFIAEQIRNGNHYMVYSNATQRLELNVRNSQRNEILHETDRLCYSVQNKLTSPETTFNFIPAKKKEADDEWFGKMGRLREYLDNSVATKEKWDDSAYDMATAGLGIAKIGYDFSAKFFNENGEEIIDGMPTFEIASYWNVYWDPSCTNREDSRYWDYVKPYDVEYIKERWGKEIKPDNKLCPSEYGESSIKLRKKLNKVQTDTALVHETWLKHIYKEEQSAEYEGKEEKRNIVCHDWIVVYWVEGEPEPLEIQKDVYKDNDHPFIVGKLRTIPRSLEGKGEVDNLAAYNLSADKLFTLYLTIVKKLGGAKIFGERGAVRKSDFTNEAAQYIEYTKGFTPPTGVTMPNPPSSIMEMLNFILMKMEDTANAHDASIGRDPRTSGKAIESRRQLDSGDGYYKITNFESFKQQVYLKLFRRIADLWSVEHQIAVVGKDGQVEYEDINPKDVALQSIKVELSTSSATTQQSKQDDAKELGQLGILPPEEVLKAYKYSNIADILTKRKAEIAEGTMPQAGGIGGISPTQMAGQGASAPELPPEQMMMSPEELKAKIPPELAAMMQG